MAIRIGSSCVLSLPMAMGNVVETRRFLDIPSQWYEISKKCITEKKFLIVTLCIDKNGKLEYIPSESQWRNFVEATVLQLQSIGANKYNCRIDIINEPCKYIDKTTYVYFVNMAHNQINGRLPMGAGCEEFITAQACGDMYPHLLRYGNFEILVIHIQGSCLSEDACSRWTNLALNWAVTYKKQLDCNEANYFSIDTDSGYKGLLMNLKYAEKIGCANFPIVFMNLDKSAFNVNTDKWERLSFFVNGKLHSSYWNDFKNIIESKCPVPNITEPIIIERKDGMILPTTKYGSKGYLAELVQELLIELGFYNGEIDGQFFNTSVNALKDFQISIKDKYPNIDVDGSCGRKGYYYLINEITDSDIRKRYQFKLDVYASPVK